MGRTDAVRALIAITACAPWAFAPLSARQSSPPDPADPPAVIRTSPAADRRVTIPISIDGKGPWPFIIDTGSQRTVVSSALAARLGLREQRAATMLSMTGRSQVRTVAVPRLRFGNSLIDDIEAPVLDADHLGAPGLLGLDGLHAKRLLLDFRTGRMEIRSSSARLRSQPPNAIVVEARRRKGQLILLHSEVNGSPVSIILDTGSAISVGNPALMALLLRRKRAPALRPAALISVTGKQLPGLVGEIASIRMGAVTLRHVPALFADAEPFAELGLKTKPALLLGIDALRIFDRVAIDFGRGRVDFLLPESALDRPYLASTTGAEARSPADSG